MNKAIFKFISTILLISLMLCFIPSCGSESSGNASPDEILSDILKSYRTDGMKIWWEIVAVYNSGENPMDYKGFDEILVSLEGTTTNLKMASYVIITNIAAVIGADAGYFEEYEPYKSKLKNLLENPSSDNNINDYIFAYYALKCSGTNFDENEFASYMKSVQGDDGSYSMSGMSGDSDMTAFAIPALKLLAYNQAAEVREILDNAVIFLETSINGNGTFSSYDIENANSTACAVSALVSYTNADAYSDENETLKNAMSGLSVFKVPKEAGYAYRTSEKSDSLATAQAAIALGDAKNKTSVWEKLYNDSVEAFEDVG